MSARPRTCSDKELRGLLQGADDEALFAAARQTRERVFGKDVYLRGIVEFSSHCRRQCQYCGLRADNHSQQRYRLPVDEIVKAAAMAPELGLGTVVLQSGEDARFDAGTVGEIVSRIKQLGMAVTLSLGERHREELQYWRKCGADRYLLKFETSNPELHARLRPGCSLAKRLACLETLRELGYEIGAGCIVGLPGQCLDDLIQDLRLMQRLQPEMASAGPFLPHPDTPLGHEPPGSVPLCLRFMALLRLLVPQANIPATSALEVAQSEGRLLGLQAGGNVIMPTITPAAVRAGYAIYPGKNAAGDDLRVLVQQVKQTIHQAGLRPSAAAGPSPGYLRHREQEHV